MAQDQIADDQQKTDESVSIKERSLRVPEGRQVEESLLATEYDTKWEDMKAKARADVKASVTDAQGTQVLAKRFDSIRSSSEQKTKVPSEHSRPESVEMFDENASKLEKAIGRSQGKGRLEVRLKQPPSGMPQALGDAQEQELDDSSLEQSVTGVEKKEFAERKVIKQPEPQLSNALAGKSALGTGSEKSPAREESEGVSEEGSEEQEVEPVGARFQTKSLGTEAEIQAIAAEANMLLDKLLMQAVGQVWLWSLPSCGLAIVLGALAGDFLWVFKSALVKRVLSPLLLAKGARFQGMSEEIARQVKISAKVKANIIAFNATIVALVMAVIVVLVLTLYIFCNAPGMGIFQVNSSFGQMCKALNSTALVGSFNNAVNRTLPQIGGKFSTAQWDTKIIQYSSQNGIDPCVLKVVVQKESGGNPDAVGHDNHFRGGDPPDFNNPPTYGLNWNYSHGIGLTQWTIFPYDGKNWMNASTPSRNIFGQWYTGEDFRNPDTSLNLTARSFAERIRTQGSIREAFRSYNGSGPAAQAYADSAMSLYNLCQSQMSLGN